MDIADHAALRKNGVPEMALDGISPATLGAELTYLFGVLDHADIMWGVQLDMNARAKISYRTLLPKQIPPQIPLAKAQKFR